MRKGFTTGSCAAAAAKAATLMLITHTPKERIEILTPAGIKYSPKVEMIELKEDYAQCGICKDGGDDIDATTGLMICARVSLNEELPHGEVAITGGEGVGIVTKKGLEMGVGEYAINLVPRQMIREEVSEVLTMYDVPYGAKVSIFVPDGEKAAEKTFNSRIGVEGGISILGTSGIVEPMSVEAILRTIELDLKVKYEAGERIAILVPGNYGERFLMDNYKIPASRIVMFSNYIGTAIDKAIEVGFNKLLVVGHTGKLIKVSGGIMNTHSKEADSRMELMVAAMLVAADRKNIELPNKLAIDMLNAVTTTAGLELLNENALLYETSEVILEKILYHLRKRASGEATIECMLYENSFGLLAKSSDAEAYL